MDTITLTLDGLIDILKQLVDNGDIEMRHVHADEALLQYINNEEVTKLYNNLYKWYA